MATEQELIAAVRGGDVVIVTRLIAATPALVNAHAESGEAVLVDVLLAAGAQVNVSSRNPLKVMPLHSSVAARQYGISKALIEHGADVNSTQQDDYTPLHEAAQNGDIEMIKLLLAHGANTKARITSGETPHATALKASHTTAAELIDKHG